MMIITLIIGLMSILDVHACGGGTNAQTTATTALNTVRTFQDFFELMFFQFEMF